MNIALIWFILSILYKIQQWFNNHYINLDIARKLVMSKYQVNKTVVM